MSKRIKPLDPSTIGMNTDTGDGDLGFFGRITRRLRRRVGKYLSDRGLKDHVVPVAWHQEGQS